MTKRHGKSKRLYSLSLLIVTLCLVEVPAPVQARPSDRDAEARDAAPAQQEQAPGILHLMVGRSLVISSPTRLKRVSIANPEIADAIIVSPYQILVNGKAAGGVSLVLWDEADQSQTFDLFVDLDILGISQKLREVFPNEPVRLEATKDVVILSGQVSSKETADKILELVSATTPKVTSLLEIPPPPPAREILLEVKFAEVNRAALSQFGVNLLSTGAASTLGSTTTGQFGNLGDLEITDAFGVRADPFPEVPAPTTGPSQNVFQSTQTITDLLNIFLFRPDIHLGAVIRALQQRNLLQILAEPNLLTQAGKEASFLAGGEFPFPIVQATTAGNAITIQFKEFGVRLSFTPTLTPEGKIHLKVRPEVSALDFANALTISGFLIPALSTRRVETEMELLEGQSFAIAGLVDDRLTESAQKIPFLGDIPILGKLFRSRSTNRTKTELLVMVTPRIVQPAPIQPLPAGPQFPKPFLPPAAPEKPSSPGQ